MQNNMPNFTESGQDTKNQKFSEPLNKNLALICLTIVLVCLIAAGVFLYNNRNSSSGNVANGNVPGQQVLNQPQGPVKVSVDNDAVLGDKNAPVTMIEFSDYECPFCKRHFTDVYPKIKKEYIDTGKLKLVFRDFIAVQGHNPLATLEAMAAECAREQGGDGAYFKYHDELFKRTTSNGNGLTSNQLLAIAKDTGLNAATLQLCLDSNKFKEEVAKDNADAASVGINGTPSFFVGKSSPDGVIQGTVIVGAQPFETFKALIDASLASGK